MRRQKPNITIMTDASSAKIKNSTNLLKRIYIFFLNVTEYV